MFFILSQVFFFLSIMLALAIDFNYPDAVYLNLFAGALPIAIFCINALYVIKALESCSHRSTNAMLETFDKVVIKDINSLINKVTLWHTKI